MAKHEVYMYIAILFRVYGYWIYNHLLCWLRFRSKKSFCFLIFTLNKQFWSQILNEYCYVSLHFNMLVSSLYYNRCDCYCNYQCNSPFDKNLASLIDTV